METAHRSWKRRLKDWSIVLGLLVLIFIFAVAVWFREESNPVVPGAFYTPPDPLPDGASGLVIRSEELTRDLPTGSQAWRILYKSTDLNDQPIAVSGLLVTPTAKTDGPRPIIAIARGTQGIYPYCATSQLPTPFSDFDHLQTMIDEGFVVVISDYPGLGTPGIHPYLVGKVEAQAVLDSVRAARNLVPDAGTEFGIIGASQGGHAAMFSSQLAPEYAPELTLKGTVTQAGAFDLAGILEARTDDRVGAILFPYVFYAWSHTYPDVSMEGAIAPGMEDKVEQLARTCLTTPLGYLKIRDIPNGGDLLAIDPTQVEPWKSLIAENTPTGSVETPLLLVHGTADVVIPFEGSVQEAARRCSEGEDVTFLRYPQTNHAAVPESMLTAIGWMEDRFADRPSTSNCSERAAPGVSS